MLNKFKSVLSSSEMKNITGGVYPHGSCGYKRPGAQPNCGVTREVAQNAVAGGGNWCCDSCAQTSYCGGGSNEDHGPLLD